MSSPVDFVLNGRSHSLREVSPNTTLLEYLRQHGLTGAKEGCAEGDCGACSVVVLERNHTGQPTYRAVNSCLMPVCLLAGREVVSVEGVGGAGKLHPVQQQMVSCLGSQCGYCTPGFICSLFEGYYRDDLRTASDLDEQLAGNLCRCTGYRPIRAAAREAFSFRSNLREKAQTSSSTAKELPAVQNSDPFLTRLQHPVPLLPAAEYTWRDEHFFRPTSLADLFILHQQHPDARLIAGATELGLDITKRYKIFSKLISVEAVAELKEVKATEAAWHIGGAVTLTEIQDQLAAEYPALGDMLRVFGSRQIRNRATMGGNLVTASPIGDSAPVLLALDAQVVLASGDGERTLPLEQFFLSYRKTALQAGEVLKAIVLPREASQSGLIRKSAWFKVSKRREMDISTVAACYVVDLDAANVIRHARLAFGGVASMPARAQQAEAALLGRPWNQDTLCLAELALRTEFTPISDVRGSAEYRLGLITDLWRKFASCSLAPGFNPVLSGEKSPAALAASRPGKTVETVLPSGVADTGLKPGVNGTAQEEGAGENRQSRSRLTGPVATNSIPHESAHKHVTGEAMYTDDQPGGKAFLEVWPVCSPHAHAKILRRDVTAARQMPGIRAVLLAEDIPGWNDVGAVKHDETLLAAKEVLFHGHLVAVVVGESQAACRAAAERVIVEYEPLPPVLTVREALAVGSFHNEPNFIRRGEMEQGLKTSPHTLEGEFEFGGQEHFYLETNAAWAEPGEDGAMFVCSSTQHPSEVQVVVAHVLHQPVNRVVVQSPRMGGGFGGKETQAATPAALAALAAHHTGRPVRVRWNRDQDMALTGHRHPFLARFQVGYDAEGHLLAVRAHLWSNGGWSLDLSQAVTDRALFHLDNAYYLPVVEWRGQVAKTNLSSNTAFRGFGGPQGMLVMEEIMDRVARRLGLPPELVRERNLYHGTGATNTTPYGQEIEDNRLQTIWQELKRSSDFAQRRKEIVTWNHAHPHAKRGLAMTPVKFGISFTVTHLNQAGALVLLYQDGSVQLNHGGTEMGQGLHTNMILIAAKELGIAPEQIRAMPTSTDKVPNTSATAASSGTDLNGAAVQNACEILRRRLAVVAATLLTAELGRTAETVAAEDVIFADGKVFSRTHPQVTLPFAQVVQQAYFARVSLSATGYYATPGIHWDRVAGRGKPFHYFANGAAVTEVEVDGFTGMHRVLRVDILHDVGDSIAEGINRGQIEGGFVQGMGWLTAEELKWDGEGRLLTHSPDTYKIPAIGDTPEIFNVTLLQNATQKNVVHGSKAVGEPPLMLAISVREALRDAVAAFGDGPGEVPLASPATCEALWRAIQCRKEKI